MRGLFLSILGSTSLQEDWYDRQDIFKMDSLTLDLDGCVCNERWSCWRVHDTEKLSYNSGSLTYICAMQRKISRFFLGITLAFLQRSELSKPAMFHWWHLDKFTPIMTIRPAVTHPISNPESRVWGYKDDGRDIPSIF